MKKGIVFYQAIINGQTYDMTRNQWLCSFRLNFSSAVYDGMKEVLNKIQYICLSPRLYMPGFSKMPTPCPLFSYELTKEGKWWAHDEYLDETRVLHALEKFCDKYNLEKTRTEIPNYDKKLSSLDWRWRPKESDIDLLLADLEEIDCKGLAEIFINEIIKAIKGQSVKKLEDKIKNEWEAMHHNAYLKGEWPNIDLSSNDGYKEWERFWECVSEEAQFELDEDLPTICKEKFGMNLTFYQYGRGGATVYPDEYSTGGYNYCLGYEKLPNYDDGNSLETFNEMVNILELFKFINQYCKDYCKNNWADWWKELKNSNAWTFGDEDDEECEEDIDTDTAVNE